MENMFDTRGIVITSTNRNEHASTPNQLDWVNRYFGDVYREEAKNLNKNIGGYPEEMTFMQSCIKESAEKYNPAAQYTSLANYATVKALFDETACELDLIYVLCWGSLTEPAILVNHCLNTGRTDILDKLVFIAHWTNSPWHQGSMEHPEDVANCREDADACAYMKQMALDGHIKYYECGAIGQHGIVSGSPKGEEYYSQFKVSQLGKIYAEGKYVFDCVDDSDAATYWVLLGDWGVTLNDICSNGTNFSEVEKMNEEKFNAWSERIHDELLRRARAASE